MATRTNLIEKGKIYQVWNKLDDSVWFEGTKTSCISFMKSHNLYKDWKLGKGLVGFGKLIWEKQ